MEAVAHAADHSDIAFDFSGRVAVVTGGSGLIGGAIARGLQSSGARVAVISRRAATASSSQLWQELRADVLDPAQLDETRRWLLSEWGRVDILVNAAGGNRPGATVAPDGSFFDLDPGELRDVMDLNLMGTLLPTQAFGRLMAESGRGSIVNISSVSATRPLTRTVGYGAAKAGIDNVTRWLADHAARRWGPEIRVNAVAPGFLVSDQNRALLLAPDGALTERGRSVIDRTPMGRFGEAGDVVGPVLWLASDASRFVTGAVIPVDGGFTAMAGV